MDKKTFMASGGVAKAGSASIDGIASELARRRQKRTIAPASLPLRSSPRESSSSVTSRGRVDLEEIISQLEFRRRARADAIRAENAYQREPLFAREELDLSDADDKEKTGLCERLGNVLASGFKVKAWHAPERTAADFREEVEKKRDDILAPDRERAREMEKERRDTLLKLKVEELYEEEREKLKRQRRVQERWHQHRYDEEDLIRREYLQDLYGPHETITDAHDFAHGNLSRIWPGFELGAVGRNNTVAYPSVIPSADEILKAKYPHFKTNTWSDRDYSTDSDSASVAPLVPSRFNTVQDAVRAIESSSSVIELLERTVGPEKGSRNRHVLRTLKAQRAQAEQALGRFFLRGIRKGEGQPGAVEESRDGTAHHKKDGTSYVKLAKSNRALPVSLG